MFEKEVGKILSKDYAEKVQIKPCPMQPDKFTHEIGTGFKAQCYQCGQSFKLPKMLSNEEKVKQITLLAKKTALECLPEKQRKPHELEDGEYIGNLWMKQGFNEAISQAEQAINMKIWK